MADTAVHNPLTDLRPRRPVMELLWIAGPTVAQMASYTLMQFLDAVMLARSDWGNDAATAASNSGIIAFAFIAMGMGVMWVVNTLVSQHFGQRDFGGCGRYMWQGLWVAGGFSLLLLPLLAVARPMFTAFGHPAHLVGPESVYFQIVIGGAIFKLAGTAMGQFLLAINRAHEVFISTFFGMLVNVGAAYVLIYGLGPIPAMGVAGSAWAQNIGPAVEAAVLVAFLSRRHLRAVFGLVDWRLRWKEAKTLLRIGIPSGLQIVADVAAWGLFINVVLGAFPHPESIMAANTFMFKYMAVSFMPAVGIGTAVTALVGRYIGAGRPDIAVRRAHLGFAMCAIYMLACGLTFYLGRDLLISAFTQDAEVRRIGALLLTFAAVYQFFDALYINYNGALRGAGDTLVPAIATGVLCWGITVAGGYAIVCLHPEWGAAGPWTAATTYGIVLGIWMIGRFARGKWKTIHLNGAVSPVPSPGTPGEGAGAA